jgi:hypothetical protein
MHIFLIDDRFVIWQRIHADRFRVAVLERHDGKLQGMYTEDTLRMCIYFVRTMFAQAELRM